MAKSEAFDIRDEQDARDRAAQASELRQLTQDSDVQWLMSTQQGRRIMWRLLSLAGVYRISFSGEETHQTAFAEGQRNIGLVFMNDLQTLCPERYAQMVSEQQNSDDSGNRIN